MSDIAMRPDLLLQHFARLAEAPDALPRLRLFILDLAVRGKLVDQDLKDEPASYLLMRIQAENRQLENTFPPLAEDEQPFTIPQSWAWIRLGNAAHVEMGQSPPSENYNQSGDGIPFYQGKTDFGLRHPTPRYWCDLPSKLAQKNDLLISVRAPVGPTNVASEECCIGRGLAALRPHHGVYLEFLLYSLKGFESAIAAMGYGTTFVAITKKQLVSFAVPLPPLAEQHRIVSKVDELMALCDRLEAAQAERESRRDRLASSSLHRLNNGVDPDAFRDHARFYFNHLPRLTTKREHIQQLRQTILNLAVHGKLVPQDRSEEPATHLLDQLTANAKAYASEHGIAPPNPDPISKEDMDFPAPSGWKWVRLASLFKVITDGDHQPPPKANDGIAFLTIGNITTGKLDFTNCRFVGEEYWKSLSPYRKPVFGDILKGTSKNSNMFR
ncbi:MAG: restriction endonuclease subunit S [Nitrospirota bacterium]